MKYFKIFFQCISLYLSVLYAKVKSVSLELYNNYNAGGKEIFIEIVQGQISCKVKKVSSISRGETKTWRDESDLGTCNTTTFDISESQINFKTITTHSNFFESDDFKPKRVTIKIGNSTFKSDVINDWVDVGKGLDLRRATKSIGKPHL